MTTATMSNETPTRVPSVWRGLLWAWRRGGDGGGVTRTRLLWRALVATTRWGGAMRRWMSVVFELNSRGLMTDPAGEYMRAVRPYVHRHTSYSARVLQLIDFVDWMESAFKPAALQKLLQGEDLVLAELQPPRGCDSMRLQLRRAPVQSPEGELLLTLMVQRSPDVQHNAQPVEAAALGFSVFRLEGSGCLVIGGVRGPRHPVQRVSTVEISQAMSGWKPSVLMVRVAQELARFWGLKLVGLNPSSHTLQGWTFQFNERHRNAAQRIYDSYDALWEHFGATKGPPGWMVLPLDSDDKLAATALSPEKRERQIRRADFWMRTRRRLHADARELLQRPGREARLSRATQSMQPDDDADWEDESPPSPQIIPPRKQRVLETGPADLA
ncbi:DUF535 domain-containing protein [Caenimonas sedimenti]|uniref:DUF535 domain-containing protein n=1 Tax=Caenimonas sedimenti TaxID=2596921 RepID=A0A562ZMS3_9BURK|nr:DUF535 family protein [Caenimonas sedimenti]TWO69717.1 DUF535 domain-containing protein [Caenimonas sedimenti]